ncbi:MAG: NAD(P)-dependent oxidoreductase [Planctomycetes bacterium]|nr:NAD(P)-dependent oxidoreductase [Planctomycetota bacterium]
MGANMAGHLLGAGAELFVHSRTQVKARGLVEAGARWMGDLPSLARVSEVVITMVGFPEDVEEVYFGLLAEARPGTLLIDMTTTRPALARRIATCGEERGLLVLDAPVSGGESGARSAELSIMVGGRRAIFEVALPLLEKMGSRIVLQGPAGSGQQVKLCNQIAIAASMLGVCEAMATAECLHLDPAEVLKSISGGAAGSWSLSHLAPKMIGRDWRAGFFVKHFLKDLRLAIEEAEAAGLDLPGLRLATSLYDNLSAVGGAEQGTQALYRRYCERDKTR